MFCVVCVCVCDQIEWAMWALNALLRLKSTAYISARLCSPVMLSAVLSHQVWAPNTRRAIFANIEWMDTGTWRNGKYFGSESVSAPLSLDSATAFLTWYRALGDLRVIFRTWGMEFVVLGAIVHQVINEIPKNLQSTVFRWSYWRCLATAEADRRRWVHGNGSTLNISHGFLAGKASLDSFRRCCFVDFIALFVGFHV